MTARAMASGGEKSHFAPGEASSPRRPLKLSERIAGGLQFGATDAHLRAYTTMLVRQGLPYISEFQWGLLLCASFFGLLRRRQYLAATLGRVNEPPVGVPPYAVAWVLRLATVLLVFSLRGVRRASRRLEAWPRGTGRLSGCARRALLCGLLTIECLVRILAVVSLAGEVYFWALTPAYQRHAATLDVRSILDPEAPRWLVIFSTLLFWLNMVSFTYSVVVIVITALYLYVWVSALVSGSRNDDVERTLEEGRLDGDVEKIGINNLYLEIVEGGLEENIDVLSDSA
ncbi:hypothetical protein F5X99DRAFT_390091 [Biscogniauxia marginata]|nr:hypothetical protein F5X99DRAFT_390091 [Biscogniauxia marginata]